MAIYYETSGDASGRPLVLVEGFTKQLLGWKPDYYLRLVDAGIFVIRFDNRDVGLSQKFGTRTDLDGGYSADDMADDIFAVMDDLAIDSAHVGGQSMGGAVAQLAAARAPERVRSLSLFYTAGDLAKYALPGSSRNDVNDVQPDRTLDEYIEFYLDNEYACRSTAYPFDEAWHRQLAASSYRRSYTPEGPARQLAALTRHPFDGASALARSEIPVSIIHGRADLVIDFHGAIALADALPNSELHLFPGLGHEMPSALLPEFTAVTLRTIGRVESTA
ncbi:alpha/beta fold hydrolase [Herbiconiux sp. P16]|uniref:alpha/beta fold hydrolase n=1 Tax=Herbiconiux wuyangfengii TaxID=3342794 RepID=UPI0035BAA4A5